MVDPVVPLVVEPQICGRTGRRAERAGPERKPKVVHSRGIWIATLVVLVGVALSPGWAEAQMDLGGATRVSFSGNLTNLTKPDALNATVLMGLSRISEGGAEFGGDLILNMSSTPATTGSPASRVVTGFGFFRAGYNFIGESLTVPFITGGVGLPFQRESDQLFFYYSASGGVKRFINESASFDVAGNYQGVLSGGQGAFSGGQFSVQFGMSLYFGN